ncbi:MAG: hypothetical protein OQJ89_01085 [Kangiellaceae bacterium]|nr:hypothetical protein [Kangiellaceae bacterium]MCW9015536.1 hypothetical protein [Kangiellaceae bacterium]
MKGEVIQLTCREQIDLDLELTSYVSGNMTSQEKLAFESRLVNDKLLQQKLADEIKLKNQFIGSRSNSPSFNLDFKDLEEKLDSRPTRKYSLIAASLFVVIGIGYFMVPNTEPNTIINEFETLTSSGSGTTEATDTYTLVFNSTASVEERAQILSELQLEQISIAKLQGLQQKRLIVKAEEPLSKAQLDLIRSHQKIILFEANSGVKEQ